MVLSSSGGATCVSSLQACRTSPPRSRGYHNSPAYASASGNSSSSIETTTPKLPPPPRTAQKQIGLALAVRPDELPVGGDELDRMDVVRRQTVPAAEHADAPADRVADDADVRRGAGRRRQSVGSSGLHELQRAGSRFGAGNARPRVDRHAAHPLGPEQQRVVQRAQRRGVVARP
jgi:hypothetical protein